MFYCIKQLPCTKCAGVQGPKDHGSGKCQEACLRSLQALGVDYIDLYLIHWPGVQGLKPTDGRNQELRRQSWSDLEKLHEQGWYLAIVFDVPNIIVLDILESANIKKFFSECDVPSK